VSGAAGRAGMSPYPAYKDSGVPWLGRVPAHWEVVPGRACLKEKKVPNTGLRETTVLSLSFGQIVVKSADKLHGLVPASFETYQIVEPGDIICRPTDLQNDWNSLRFGISQNRGIITSAYLCFQTQRRLSREFGHLMLHAYDLKKVFYGLGSGLRQNLDWQDFKYLPCLVPPPDEQAAIVRYLDHADRRIRRYIRAKRRLIELLNEQKQAIIQRAVTRGLDPNVRLKPSGIEWVGEIPAHWDFLSLRKNWTVTDCKHLTVPFVEDGVPLASVRNVQDFELSLGKAKRTTEKWYENLIEGGRAPRRGDIIYCRNVSVGASAYVATDERFAMGQDVCMIRSVEQNQRFLNYFFHSAAMDRQMALLLVGSTFNRINVSKIKGLFVPLPPPAEQVVIAEYLDGVAIGLERSIENELRGIALLREYRTRLIADVVTGKVDVRNLAASLPDTIQEEIPDDSVVADETDTQDDGLDSSEETADAE
jgi:type I restriction enzyme, S subunit